MEIIGEEVNMAEYIKNTWITGDKVSASKLNNMENGIEGAYTEINSSPTATHVTFTDPVILVNNVTTTFSKDGNNNWYTSPELPFNINPNDLFNDHVKVTVIYNGQVFDDLFAEGYGAASTGGYYTWWGIGNVEPIGYISHNPKSYYCPFLIAYRWGGPNRESATSSYRILSYYQLESITITISVSTFAIQNKPTLYVENTNYNHYAAMPTSVGGVVGLRAKNATGQGATAIGIGTEAQGVGSLAGGIGGIARGQNSIALGTRCNATGAGSHAEGYECSATNNQTIADGYRTTANGNRASAHGILTTANGRAQMVFGQNNVPDSGDTYLEIVGNGTSDTQSNARTLDWYGNQSLKGSITLNKGGPTEVTITGSDIKISNYIKHRPLLQLSVLEILV